MTQPIIDAHHHIWRQADLPWLAGPMVPRIFGPYEPIRRDYLIEEYLRGHRRLRAWSSRSTSRPTGRRTRPWTRSPGCRAVADRSGWPHAIVAYADLMADDVRPDARPAAALSAASAASACSSTGTTTSSTASPARRPRRRPDLPAELRRPRRQRLSASTSRSSPPQMEGAARLAADYPGTTFILQHAGMLEDLSDERAGGMASRHAPSSPPSRT